MASEKTNLLATQADIDTTNDNIDTAKDEVIDLLNNGDLESITLGETELDETKLKALLALLENE